MEPESPDERPRAPARKKAAVRPRPSETREPQIPRALLAQRGACTIYASAESDAWRASYDALVVPSDSELGAVLVERWGTDRHVQLSDAVYGPLSSSNDAAVAVKVGETWAIGTRGAAHALAALNVAARTSGVRTLALPLPLPLDAAVALFNAIRRSRSAERLAEITLLAAEPSFVDAARAVLESRAQAVNNDLAEGEDLLNVETEVSALADTLLLRDTHPPLVAGILGGWGSGKSFAMHLIQRRMAQIRGMTIPQAQRWPEDPKAAWPWVGHLYAIEFDAWTFAKADLWSSLMHTVFFEIDRQLAIEKRIGSGEGEAERWLEIAAMDDNERAVFLSDPNADAAIAAGDTLWSALREQRQKAIDQLEAKSAALAEKQAELAESRERFRLDAEKSVREQAKEAAWRALEAELEKALGALAGDVRRRVNLGATVPAGAPAPRLGPSARGVIQTLWKHPHTVLLGIATFLVVWQAPNVVPAIGAKVAHWLEASGALGLLVALVRGWDKARRVVDEGYRMVKTRVDAEVAARGGQIAQQLEAKTTADPDFLALEKQVAEIDAEVRRLRDRAGLAGDYVSLAEFVGERLAEGGYEKTLGLVHQVQKDLRELSEALYVHPGDGHARAKQKLFWRGPPRIVLFIDDLDRCPPEKVVEVLEAVQLLVKTPLFVVVLAMDERYVTRALEKRYEGILSRDGDPSGLDYIEKIVQLPYRVRDIDEDAIRGYLEAQMAVRASETIGGDGAARSRTPAPVAASAGTVRVAPSLPTRVVEFDERELGLVEQCCRAIGLSPRAVKRVVNVYKLLKIIWFRRSGPPPEPVELAVVLMLALSARFPEQMREVLRRLGEELVTARDTGKTFKQFFEGLPAPREHADPDRAWQRLSVAATRLAPDAALSAMSEETYDLVLSFSFVGDVGYESLAPIRVELVGANPTAP